MEYAATFSETKGISGELFIACLLTLGIAITVANATMTETAGYQATFQASRTLGILVLKDLIF